MYLKTVVQNKNPHVSKVFYTPIFPLHMSLFFPIPTFQTPLSLIPLRISTTQILLRVCRPLRPQTQPIPKLV